jgi:hypothetical protein
VCPPDDFAAQPTRIDGIGCRAGHLVTDTLNRGNPVSVGRSETVTQYAVGGHEEFPVLYIRPVEQGQGVALPPELYLRWRRARAELDATQRDVLTHIRATAGADAIPSELRESQDQSSHDHPSDHAWKLS